MVCRIDWRNTKATYEYMHVKDYSDGHVELIGPTPQGELLLLNLPLSLPNRIKKTQYELNKRAREVA
jgi:hypothetical protein